MKAKATIVIILCALFLFYKYIAQLYPGLITDDLMHKYMMDGVQLAVLASSYYYSYSIMQIFAGILIDKIGVRIPCFIAILLVSLPLYLFAHTHNYILMCVLRALMGAGTAFATVTYIKCAAYYSPPKMFSIIVSLLVPAAMLGATISATPIAKLFKAQGWQHGLELISYIGIIYALIALYFLDLKNSKANADKIDIKPNKKEIIGVFFKSNNWLLMLYAAFVFSPVLILGGLWGVPFLIQKFNITASQASNFISAMFISIGIGTPLFAYITTKISNKKELMYFCNILGIISLIFIIYIPLSYLLTLALFCLLGLCVSIYILSFDICRIYNSVSLIGIASAFMNSGEGVITSFLEPLIGKVLDMRRVPGKAFQLLDFQIAFIFIIICFVISLICLYFIKIEEESFFFKKK